MSNLHAANPAQTSVGAPRRLRLWLILSGVAFIVCAVALAYGWTAIFGAAQTSQIAAKRAEEPPVKETKPPVAPKPATPSPPKKVIAKVPGKNAAAATTDQKPLWVSPTHGKPVELSYLPPGVQLIAITRPSDLLKHAEGEKIRASLGPNGDAMLQHIEKTTGVPLRYVDQLVIGGQVTSEGTWLVTFVVRTPKAMSRDKLLA